VNSIKTVVIGVNDHILDRIETIISNASCTTNNAAPMMTIVELCGIKQAYITTIHSYYRLKFTQIIHTKDLRRARQSIYCSNYYRSSEGINKRIFPTLEGK
jgi:glyceraldehyde 3-phosphate dehydrogenase